MIQAIRKISLIKVCAAIGLVGGILGAGDGFAAAVASRGGASSRGSTTSARGAAVSNPAATIPAATTTGTTTTTTATAEPVTVSGPLVIADKTSQFEEVMTDIANDMGTASNKSGGMSAVARQRAAIDAADAVAAATAKAASAAASGKNKCDTDLRACMQKKCGDDFTGCSGDGDTIWGDKMDACRRDTTCSGEEYRRFTIEIKADRDLNADLAGFDAIMDCGNGYNDCIITTCGTTMTKCLGKKAADAAIAQCNQQYKECTTRVDNGLAARTGEVLGNLRVDAEKQVQADEKRLVEMRDKMREVCARSGAMFDERTFDCVYTVSFYADGSTTPYASRKRYAGTSFDCTQEWFGINITTFKENAYRTTEDQESATMGFMGGGLGIAAGAISSGMINRAMDTQKAKNAVKKAEKEKEKDKELGDATTPANNGQSGNKVDENGGGQVDRGPSWDDAEKDIDKLHGADSASLEAAKDVDKARNYQNNREELQKSINDQMDAQREEEINALEDDDWEPSADDIKGDD